MFLNEFLDDLPIELHEVLRKLLAEDFETAMPNPKIPNSVSPINNGLAIHFRSDVTFSSPQKPSPNSIQPENNSKLNPLTFSDPEPAVDNEPRRRQSFRRPLYLRDDFLRH